MLGEKMLSRSSNQSEKYHDMPAYIVTPLDEKVWKIKGKIKFKNAKHFHLAWSYCYMFDKKLEALSF
jgi:hypothetical protein